MKLSISLEVDSQEEANEVLAALVKIANLPYRLSVFGVGTPVDPSKAVVTQSIDPKYIKHPPIPSDMVPKHGETSPSDPQDDAQPQPQTREVDQPQITPTAPTETLNVEPPGQAVGRLYTSSVEAVRKCLENGKTIPKDYLPVAKRLWVDGEIWYDGTKYRLP